MLSDAGLALPVVRIGLPDEFVAHGDQASLYREVGFTGAAVAERALQLVAAGRIA